MGGRGWRFLGVKSRPSCSRHLGIPLVQITRRCTAAGSDAGPVLIPCVTGLTRDDDGYHMDDVPGGSVVQLLAELLPTWCVVGALQHFTGEQLYAAASDLFVTDVPVTGDDREATDLVEGIIDLVPGLDAVYLGGLRTSSAVEGLAAVVREVAIDPARTGGSASVTGSTTRSGSSDAAGSRPEPPSGYPSLNGSRVPPGSSTTTDLFSRYSSTAAEPFSRPMPESPKPPKGMLGRRPGRR